MPSPEVLEAFAALVESGDYVGALERYYAPDASTQENNEAPRIGRDTLIRRERGVMSAFKSIAAKRLAPIAVNGDSVAIQWRFEFAAHEGTGFVLEEVAWQTWRGNLIASEKFHFDPNQRA
jgi:hypothetical protein